MVRWESIQRRSNESDEGILFPELMAEFVLDNLREIILFDL